MDTQQVKEIVEAIKTINLNINSETGVKAVQAIADKIGFWLVMREVFHFIEFVIVGVIVVLLSIIFSKIIFRKIQSDKQKDAIWRLIDLENPNIELIKELLNK